METSPAPVPSRPQPSLPPAEAPVPPDDQAAADLPPPPPPDVDEEPITPAERHAIPAASTTKRAPAAEPTAGATPAASVSTPSQQQAITPRTAAPAEPRQGFVVQLGLFTSVENAQSLYARLKQQGIPAFLETRVVVGPFRDHAEADAAQRKLRALGVSGVIVQRE